MRYEIGDLASLLSRRYLCRTAIVFYLLVIGAASNYAATDYGEISVEAEIFSPYRTYQGYGEFRVKIINHSQTRSHRVTIVMPAHSYTGSEVTIREIERTVEVGAAATVIVSLFQPPLDLSGTGLAVIIDGERQPTTMDVDFGKYGSWVGRSGGDAILLLVTKEISKSGVMGKAEEALKDPSGIQQMSYLPLDLPLQEWSTNWLAYSRFHGIVVTAEDLKSMPPAVQSALWRYLESGGTMFIFGSWEVPAQWQSRREILFEQSEEENENKAKLSVNKASANGSSSFFHIGYGTLIVRKGSIQQGLSSLPWEMARLAWQQSRDSQQNQWQFNQRGNNVEFSVVDKLTVPLRGMFLVMLLFVIVIGPVNLLVLARRRKKIWLLWTVPAISLLTCMCVAGYALWNEGFKGYERTEVMTVLDETAHQATTIGYTGFYSPLTPSEGLHFSYETELTPILYGPMGWISRGGGTRSMDWTNDQHLKAGWVTARVPSYFRIRKCETRRERLTLWQERDGTIAIVNGLGAEIEKLWLADSSGRIHSETKVQAGAQARLSLTQLQAHGIPSGLRDSIRSYWLDQIRMYEQYPERVLMPNTYLAVLNASPFVEAGLRGVHERRGKTLVYGIQAVTER